MTSSDTPDNEENEQFTNCDEFSKFKETFDENGPAEVRLNEFQQHVEEVTARATRPLNDAEIRKLFDICDGNQDGKLTKKELGHVYEWFRPIIAPRRALVNVDVQNDFISGSLALRNCPACQDGAEVVPVINKIIETMRFDMVAYSVDDHPIDHISFIENVNDWKLDKTSEIQDPDKIKVGDVVVFDTRFGPVEQKIWPKHCVKGTPGNDFHKDMKITADKVIVKKGYIRDVESYTAFGSPKYDAPTNLQGELEKHKITEMYVTGLALEVCVGNTGLDALKLGYSVCMIEDAQRGIAEDSIADMKEAVIEIGGHYVSSDEVIKANGTITLDDRLDSIRRKLSLETVVEQMA